MIRTPNTQEEWDEYYQLRYQVLRAPWKQAIGSERNEGDETAQHFAFFEEGKIIGVGRLDYMSEVIAQVRFMAIAGNRQGEGIGKKLMQHMEEIAVETGRTELILHAREIALPFYKNLGYTITEKSHLLFGEIQHYLMRKNHESIC
jgi:N-acetylglutamate synthase-like GNAT family acetyltransferase